VLFGPGDGVMPGDTSRTARESWPSPEQVGAMNDIQSAGNLREELREAYRGLPENIQEYLTCLLRESAAGTARRQMCEPALRTRKLRAASNLSFEVS
jgi:hypothetical protein